MGLKNIVAIIPSNGESKGTSGKDLRMIAGLPVIAWTIKQTKASKLINHIFVSTDSEEIARVSRQYGADVVELPKNLAGDIATSEKSLLYVMDCIEKLKEIEIDLVLSLQPTSPIREKDDIDKAIDKFITEKADSLFSVTKLENFLIWEKSSNRYISTNYDYRNRKRRQGVKPSYLENGSIYISKPGLLKKVHNRLGGKIAVYEMPFWKSCQIDRQDNLEVCSYYLNKIKGQFCENKINIKDIELIVYDFDGIMTDNRVITFENGREAIIANRGDGAAINILKIKKIPQIIISTEKNKVVSARANKIGLPVLQGINDKKGRLINYCKKNGINLRNVVYLGNDLNDLEAMRIVGYPMSPTDAHQDVKNISKVILPKKGGDSLLSELVKLIN